jgi:hypothetical protein
MDAAVEATSKGFEGFMVVVLIGVIASAGTLLAKSKPTKETLPNHLRADEETTKKYPPFLAYEVS